MYNLVVTFVAIMFSGAVEEERVVLHTYDSGIECAIVQSDLVFQTSSDSTAFNTGALKFSCDEVPFPRERPE